MTRLIIICSLFLTLFAGASFTASANSNKSVTGTENVTKESNTGNHSEPAASKSVPNAPVTKTVPPVHPEEKGHTPKLDELAHIHRFHKERVKKVKRHHKKVWSLSMLILVLCHISILIMAYMHVTPH
jgi:Na+/H+ antiporter NhaC